VGSLLDLFGGGVARGRPHVHTYEQVNSVGREQGHRQGTIDRDTHTYMHTHVDKQAHTHTHTHTTTTYSCVHHKQVDKARRADSKVTPWARGLQCPERHAKAEAERSRCGKDTHIHTHTRTHTYTHVHTHAYTRTHTYTRITLCQQYPLPPSEL
jgi:hypothetical protein